MIKELPIPYKEVLLVYVVFLISVINITLNRENLISLTVLLSVLGIAGYLAYKLKYKAYKGLFLLWILAQVPILTTTGELQSDMVDHHVIFDVSQVFNVTFNLHFDIPYDTKMYAVKFNVIPAFYYAFYQFLISSSLVSTVVSIMPASGYSPLSKFLPVTARIVRLKNGSFVGKLETRITINDVIYEKVIFGTAGGSIFQPGKDRQKCHVTLISYNNQNNIETEGFVK